MELISRIFINKYTLCLVFPLLTALVSIPSPDNNKDTWQNFFKNLTGRWQLTGTMKAQTLHQECSGDWVLNRSFFRFRCRAAAPDSSGYESIYMIGYDTEQKRYLFHLFDIYGGSYSDTIGYGTLNGNRILFTFDYPQGAFQNEFIYNENKNRWTMVLRQENMEGGWSLFAEKTLVEIE